MIKIVKANQIKENIRLQVSKLFVDSFYNYFSFICDDKSKLYKVFNHTFILDNFYVVYLDEEIIGIGACSDGSASIKLSKIKFCYHLGSNKGKRLFNYLKTIFEDRDYAFEIDKQCGMIEFLAVKESYRNKKVGYTLVNHIMYDKAYKRYLAKVGDNNCSAMKIFEKIGFEVFDEESATSKEKELVEVNKYLYMIGEISKEVN